MARELHTYPFGLSLSKADPFMVRLAHHERNEDIRCCIAYARLNKWGLEAENKSPLPTSGGEGEGEGAKSRGLARGLRRRQTDCERVLWRQLRDRQIHQAKFRRQHPIGPYIVDFCCPAHRLVVELDGGHHATQVSADERRTEFLIHRGLSGAPVLGSRRIGQS